MRKLISRRRLSVQLNLSKFTRGVSSDPHVNLESIPFRDGFRGLTVDMLNGVTVEISESRSGAVYIDISNHQDSATVVRESKDEHDTFHCHQVDTLLLPEDSDKSTRVRVKQFNEKPLL